MIAEEFSQVEVELRRVIDTLRREEAPPAVMQNLINQLEKHAAKVPQLYTKNDIPGMRRLLAELEGETEAALELAENKTDLSLKSRNNLRLAHSSIFQLCRKTQRT